MKKKKSSKKLIAIVLAAVVVVLGVMTILSQAMGEKEITPTVATIKATRGDIELNLDTSGAVESKNKKTFFSPVNGTIKMLGMEKGDSVKTGTKLVSFDLETLEDENKKLELSGRTGELDIQDTIDTANKAASKQAAAAANVGPLQAYIDAQKTYINDLKNAIAQATKDAQEDAVSQAEASAKEQKKAIDKAYKKAVKTYNAEVKKYNTNLAKAKTDLDNATAAYNTADAKYQMEFQLWESGQSTEQNVLDTALTEKNNAEIAMRDATEAYDTLFNNPPAAPEQPDYSSIASTVDPTAVVADTTELQNELENASADLAEAQGELSQEKAVAEADAGGVSSATLEKLEISNNLSDLEAKSLAELIEEGRKGVEAEFAGVISDCKVVEGATVTQGMELFTLQSTEDVKVSVSISKNDYDKVKEGQAATVVMGDHTYQGTVEKISRIATPNEKGTPIIDAQVRIDNPDENIFIGVDAKVTIEADKATDVILVPVTAVNIGNNGSFCYAIENGVIVEKPVVTGISSVDYIEIKEGLTEETDILTDIGTYQIGDKVDAAPMPAAAGETGTDPSAATATTGQE